MCFDVLDDGVLKKISNAFFPSYGATDLRRTDFTLDPLFHDENFVPKMDGGRNVTRTVEISSMTAVNRGGNVKIVFTTILTRVKIKRVPKW